MCFLQAGFVENIVSIAKFHLQNLQMNELALNELAHSVAGGYQFT